MSETDDLIERAKRALARLNAADKKFNATWQRMGYDSVQPQKPVKRRAKRRT
jgi:hypothetical protein